MDASSTSTDSSSQTELTEQLNIALLFLPKLTFWRSERDERKRKNVVLSTYLDGISDKNNYHTNLPLLSKVYLVDAGAYE